MSDPRLGAPTRASASTAPMVTVVVPTYQRCRELARLLSALGRQLYPMDRFGVVVSVDGSTDGTREMLERFEAPYALRWHWQPNTGRAAARNAGIARARGEIIAFLDDDMEPSEGFIASHAAEHPPGSRRVVVGAAPVVLHDGVPGVVTYVGQKFNRHLEELATPGRPLGLRDFYSGNFSVPRHVLQEVGGFDESFRLYGNEDLELSWRLRRAGVEIAFSPAAVAHQYYTKDFAGLARDNIAKGRTAVLLARKHPEALAELKLGTFDRGSRARRLVLRSLLALTRTLPQTPNAIMRVLGAMTRSRDPRLQRVYQFSLDYFFWVGATAARAEGGSRHAPTPGAEDAQPI